MEIAAVTWPTTVEAAERVQRDLRSQVRLDVTLATAPRTVAGLDVAYDPRSDRVVGAVVVLDARTHTVIGSATTRGRVSFDYVPGLLAFRELPPLVDALRELTVTPDVLICDGYGIAHPRRFGLACHLGVLTGLPTIGVAKTPFTTTFTVPGDERGAYEDLTEPGTGVTLGRVLRTRVGVRPIFVSVGHRVSLADATAIVLGLCPSYRLPETTRAADHLCRQELGRYS